MRRGSIKDLMAVSKCAERILRHSLVQNSLRLDERSGGTILASSETRMIEAQDTTSTYKSNIVRNMDDTGKIFCVGLRQSQAM